MRILSFNSNSALYWTQNFLTDMHWCIGFFRDRPPKNRHTKKNTKKIWLWLFSLRGCLFFLGLPSTQPRKVRLARIGLKTGSVNMETPVWGFLAKLPQTSKIWFCAFKRRWNYTGSSEGNISELKKKILENNEMIKNISSPLTVATSKSNASAAPPAKLQQRKQTWETKVLTNNFQMHED